jgi:PAS domain-containing protein
MRRRDDPIRAEAVPAPAPADPGALADLVAQLDVTFWAVDREHRITAVGGAGIQRLGARPEELIGRLPADVFHLADGHPFLKPVRFITGSFIKCGGDTPRRV